MSDAYDRIIEIFKEIMDFPAEQELNEDATFKELGIDSMDLVEVVFAIEEEFDIEIPDEDAEKLTTVGEAMDYVKVKLGVED